mmetsp:Transcript_72626/g.200394  ORF Transcript_72626/g.200394 Transcript_72626/m.200394 type:complete len:441 (+) Transcript_72626:167-1489(+)
MRAPFEFAVALTIARSAASGGLADAPGPLVGALPEGQAQEPGPQCDVEASGPICLGGQSRVLLPPALPEGLVGFWPFDHSLAVDASGNNNHGTGRVRAGPALAGQGSSAFFHRSYIALPGAGALYLSDFSYTFWLYLVEERTGGTPRQGLRTCPLVRKGLERRAPSPGQEVQRDAAAPAVLFDRLSRRLRVEVLTVGSEGRAVAEALESSARLAAGRWFHVAVLRIDSQRMTRLYVNGVLDNSKATQGYTSPNHEPLYIGGDPLSHEQCDVPMYIDELRVYSRPLVPDEIEAEAAPALAGIEPSFVRLGCFSCSLETAIQNCPAGYHICSSLELHTGGYQVARALGWLERGAHVWSRSPAAGPGGPGRGGPGPREGAGPAPASAAAPHPPVAALALRPSGESAQPRSAELTSPASPAAPAPGPPAPQGVTGLGLCCTDTS